LNLERIKRKAFAVAVLETKPGFGGEHDKFDFKVTKVGTGTLNEGVEEKKVGDVVKNNTWTSKKTITKLGEVISQKYSKNGCTQMKISKYRKYYRGDLCKLIEARRGREL